jgi:5-methyltetrahydrofolate--homocysteine methyltransferase
MHDYSPMNRALYDGDAATVATLTREALGAGRSAHEILNDGLIAGMRLVGDHFKQKILYLPQVLIAARAMKAGTVVLRPLLAEHGNGGKPAGVLVMGTVRGDLHDIGKNLVCMMAEGAGFDVHDIGVDQSVAKFLDAADKYNADIVGMSALLTTTMDYMKTVVVGFEAAGMRHVKLAVGGAPVTQQFADEIGADGYCADASTAVDLFLRLVASRQP